MIADRTLRHVPRSDRIMAPGRRQPGTASGTAHAAGRARLDSIRHKQKENGMTVRITRRHMIASSTLAAGGLALGAREVLAQATPATGARPSHQRRLAATRMTFWGICRPSR
jgi:hypothetical protein